MPGFDTYLSPFTWRYGTPAMRRLWSEENKRLLWRKIWVALAEVQADLGFIKPEQVEDLRLHMNEINLARVLEIEEEIQHDLMAELRLFTSQCPQGGAILHLGATSTDIEDNADALRLQASLDLLLDSLAGLLHTLCVEMDKWADTPCLGFTHLQPAEPTTLGYRLSFFGQDLLADYVNLTQLRAEIKGKGFKGAVGTSAAFMELLGNENIEAFEQALSMKLGLAFFPVASQVYPRKQDYMVVSVLAGLAASLHKMAFDLRLLQSPLAGEVSEYFSGNQVGSSAMPFKRNPIRAEKIDSLARYLASLPRLAWDNAANSLLERTLDDSANRRILLPEACLAADELIHTAMKILSRLQVDEHALAENLNLHGPFAGTEKLLIALVGKGANRQDMHERLRHLSMQAWETIRQGGANPLEQYICKDPVISGYIHELEIIRLLNPAGHIGAAPNRARAMAGSILTVIGK